jgi:hypothetical protein
MNVINARFARAADEGDVIELGEGENYKEENASTSARNLREEVAVEEDEEDEEEKEVVVFATLFAMTELVRPSRQEESQNEAKREVPQKTKKTKKEPPTTRIPWIRRFGKAFRGLVASTVL